MPHYVEWEVNVDEAGFSYVAGWELTRVSDTYHYCWTRTHVRRFSADGTLDRCSTYGPDRGCASPRAVAARGGIVAVVGVFDTRFDIGDITLDYDTDTDGGFYPPLAGFVALLSPN